jgi:hypothetical protein
MEKLLEFTSSHRNVERVVTRVGLVAMVLAEVMSLVFVVARALH